MQDSDQIGRVIGQRLRESRRLRRMTLDALSEISGLSGAFLSRLERGETSTSIGNLIRIAGAIGISLQQVFENETSASPPGYALSKRKARHGHGLLSGPGYAYEHFPGSSMEQRLETFELEHPVGVKEDFPFISHEGEEVLYLLSGRIEFQVGSETFAMEKGDCIHLQSNQPHRSWNIGTRPARLLMVVATSVGATRPRRPQVIGSPLHSNLARKVIKTGPISAPRTKRPLSIARGGPSKRAAPRSKPG